MSHTHQRLKIAFDSWVPFATSREFKSFCRRILWTNPIGTTARWALNQFPSLERAARKMVGADDSLPIYHREAAAPAAQCHMGSGGALVSIEMAKRLLGYEPIVSREQALDLTSQ